MKKWFSKHALVLMMSAVAPLFAVAQTDSPTVVPKMSFVKVEGGTFTMGSADGGRDERPLREVTVSTFHIGQYEVTQAQWNAVMETNPSNFKGDDLPVEMVSMAEIYTFMERLSVMTEGKKYRLPTEAEWEYAARGGNKSKGYRYSGGDNLRDVAWYLGDGRGTHPVGGKQPNELGIYDMSGNVWELCNDWYGRYSSRARVDPRGPSHGSYMVCRGGSWNRNADHCTVSSRSTANPERSFALGFRLVLVQ